MWPKKWGKKKRISVKISKNFFTFLWTFHLKHLWTFDGNTLASFLDQKLTQILTFSVKNFQNQIRQRFFFPSPRVHNREWKSFSNFPSKSFLLRWGHAQTVRRERNRKRNLVNFRNNKTKKFCFRQKFNRLIYFFMI